MLLMFLLKIYVQIYFFSNLLAELICHVYSEILPFLFLKMILRGACEISRPYKENYLSSDFLRTIERFFTDYRAIFYGLSSDFLRTIERFLRVSSLVFTCCITSGNLCDNRETEGAVAYENRATGNNSSANKFLIIYIIQC